MKVATYSRVSTEEQARKGYSLDAQDNTLLEFCTLYGHEIVGMYRDEGISGASMERPGLINLLEDAKEGFFDCVLIWKLSRLSRTMRDTLNILHLFAENKVTFISFSEKLDTSTPVGRLTIQILGSIAEFERNVIAENIKLALREKAMQGRWTGTLILGYDNKDKFLVVNPKEKTIVKAASRLYKKYQSLPIVAEILNEKHNTKRGKKFFPNSVCKLLRSIAHSGYVRYQKEIFKGVHEPIVPLTNFWLMHNLISRPNKNGKVDLATLDMAKFKKQARKFSKLTPAGRHDMLKKEGWLEYKYR